MEEDINPENKDEKENENAHFKGADEMRVQMKKYRSKRRMLKVKMLLRMTELKKFVESLLKKLTIPNFLWSISILSFEHSQN